MDDSDILTPLAPEFQQSGPHPHCSTWNNSEAVELSLAN